MKDLFTLLVISFSFLSLRSQPVIQWQKSYGGSSYEQSGSIQPTSDGGFIAAGFSSSLDGDVTGNHGNIDYWILKLESTGVLQWQKSLGGTNNDEASSIQQTSDGGYIVAGNSYSLNGDVTNHYGPGRDYWVVKLDNAGNIQWQKCLGGNSDDAATDVQQTTDGGYIVAGITRSNDSDVTVHYGTFATYDYWIVKLDGSGIIQWEKTYGGSQDDMAESVRQTNDGGYILAGTSKSNDSDVTNHRGPITQPDYWIVKIDSTGLLQWEKSLGGTSSDYAFTAQQTPEGGYIVSGYTNSNDSDVTVTQGWADYWIVKLDTAGDIQWQKSLGGTDDDHSYDIVQTSDNGYLATGFSLSDDGDVTGNHSGSRDCWIVKVDSTGNVVWQKSLGGTQDEWGYSICQASNSSYAIAAFSTSGNGDVTLNHGLTDCWILKITEKYNSITGTLFIDANLNGAKDTSESALTNRMVTETNSGEFAFSNQGGYYKLSVFDSGSFSVSPPLISYYNVVPANHPVSFSGIRQIDSLNDFAYQPVGAYNDLCVTISPVSRFRPFRVAYYSINYYNAGTTTLNPSITFFPDNHLSYLSASVTPAFTSSDSVTWNLPTLLPSQSGSIFVTVGVLGGITTVGDQIVAQVRIDPLIADSNLACNYSTCTIVATGSFDPNEMIVDRDTILTTELSNPPYLEYIINFQNTGNDTAFDVKVLSAIDTSEVQLNSLEYVSSSHPADISYQGWTGNLEFNFPNILLADSNVNEPASHGFIRYRILPKTTLTAGDTITGFANIYFDFNAPVLTNSVFTEIVLATDLSPYPFPKERGVIFFPNPLTTQGTLTFENEIHEMYAFSLSDITGRLVETATTTSGKVILKKGNKPAGVYLINLTNSKTGERMNTKIAIGN